MRTCKLHTQVSSFLIDVARYNWPPSRGEPFHWWKQQIDTLQYSTGSTGIEYIIIIQSFLENYNPLYSFSDLLSGEPPLRFPMMRDRQLFSAVLLVLAFVSLQKLCYCDDQTVISIFSVDLKILDLSFVFFLFRCCMNRSMRHLMAVGSYRRMVITKVLLYISTLSLFGMVLFRSAS